MTEAAMDSVDMKENGEDPSNLVINGNALQEKNPSPTVGSLHRPDPVNDDPVDFIDVVATDSPAKGPESNPIRVISSIPSSNAVMLDDEDERKIIEGLRRSRGLEPQRTRRVFFFRRDPNGQLLIDKKTSSHQSLSVEPRNQSDSPVKQQTHTTSTGESRPDSNEELIQAGEAIKEFTSKLKTLKLSQKQKDFIIQYAGCLADKLITITRESKDREIQQKLEDDRLWLRSEIDSIIEKRLGSLRVNANPQFWRTEADKFAEIALTQLMVYRENGTRKQDVLTSALAGFNMGYIQRHKCGIEIINTIKKMKDKFIENSRACRAFVDVCADFLMHNCFEKYFPCKFKKVLTMFTVFVAPLKESTNKQRNAEKYALLRHCEQIFDIKLDYKFFTMENGTGKLDRRIRTIRTTDYKKGGKIKRKRKQLNNQTKHEKREPKSKKLEMHDASLDELELSSKVKKLESKLAPRRWTTRRGPDRYASTSSMREPVSKRIRLAPSDKKIIVMKTSVRKPDEKDGESLTNPEAGDQPIIDHVDEVELPHDDD